jgi:hypothetical protein
LSRNCPGDQDEERVEASAVHFFEEEEEYSNEYETESDEISAPEISHQTNIQDCSTDRGNFSSSEENSDDGYSDSSNELHVGAIRIDLRSDRGHQLEGGRVPPTRGMIGVGMQKSKDGRLVSTSLEGRM